MTARHGLGAAVAEGRLFAVGGAAAADPASGANEQLAPLDAPVPSQGSPSGR